MANPGSNKNQGNKVTNPILLDKDGIQREISLPFSIWVTREDMDHMARRIYESLELWNKYNIDGGWLDVYEIERGRMNARPVNWARAAKLPRIDEEDHGPVEVEAKDQVEVDDEELEELEDHDDFKVVKISE